MFKLHQHPRTQASISDDFNMNRLSQKTNQSVAVQRPDEFTSLTADL
jgi:hypothetical protein